MQAYDYYPYVEVLELLCSQGNALPVKMEQLPNLELNLDMAKAWIERTNKTFMKKNTPYSLLQVYDETKLFFYFRLNRYSILQVNF